MDTYNNNIKSLIIKSLTHSTSEEEERFLNEWLDKNPEHRKIYSKISDNKNLLYKLSVLDSIDTKRSFETIKLKLKRSNNIKRITVSIAGIAASILIVISLWILNSNYFKPKNNIVTIDPGKKKAILIVDNGQRFDLHDSMNVNISIDNADVEIENSSIIYKPKTNITEPKINKIITPHGGEFSVVLPDSTKVWLNAMSEIEFPSAFTGGQRIVSVKGEAFFDVAEDKNKPFIVRLADYDVKVLGTKFNVCNYDDSQKSHTTLCSGIIEINNLKNSNKKIGLKPGDQLQFDKGNNTFEVEKVDTKIYTSWMQGYFYYMQMPLEDIVKSLSKWYDIKVVFESNISKDRLFSAKFSRYDKLETILKVMEEGSGVKFNIEGKTINIK